MRDRSVISIGLGIFQEMGLSMLGVSGRYLLSWLLPFLACPPPVPQPGSIRRGPLGHHCGHVVCHVIPVLVDS